MAEQDVMEATIEHFAFTDEQRELRAMMREFCADHSDEQTVRRLMESSPACDPKTWGRLGSELGVLGLGVPEEVGGSGGGLVEAAILVEELGASLFCGPVLGTIALAIPALVAAPVSPLRSEVLAALVEGSSVAAFAVPDRAGEFVSETVEPRAVRVGEQWAVSGVVERVVDAGDADRILVAAISDEGDLVLLVVDSAAPGVERTRLTTLDLTRPQATVRFDRVPAAALATGQEAARVCEHAFGTAAVLLAAEQVGGAQRLLDMSVAYAGHRLQFGRVIGSFQAVKHRLADTYIDLEHARSAAYHAAWSVQDVSDDPRLATSIAQATSSSAFTHAASTAVHVHGGIGFTWEHPAHLYFKRAFTDAALLGSAEQHRDRIAALVLDAAEVGTVLPVATG